MVAAGEFSTAEEAVTQATAEGLVLEPSTNATGYRGVARKDGRLSMPFTAAFVRAGKRLHLGNFAIVEEAALAVARAKARTVVPDAATGAFTGRAAPTQSKPKMFLPDDVKAVLTKWCQDNMDSPYPNEREKYDFCATMDLTFTQVNNWCVMRGSNIRTKDLLRATTPNRL